MADIDNLQIRITASAGEASKAINSLITDLGKLNMALNNYKAGSEYVKGIDNLVGGLERLGDAVSAIDPAHVKDIASSLGKLATNGDKLAKLSGKSFLSGIASESQKIAVASENARKKAEALAESYNFDKNDQGVDKLANAIDRLTASSGDPAALKDIRNEIESIIKSYARYENELHEAAKAENELIRNSQKKLNSGWQDVFGDSETARSARGKLGIGTSSKKGGSADSVITENESLGIQAAANETDNLALAFQRMQDNAYDAENAFVGFNDVSETVSGGIQQVRADIDELCQSLGIAKEKMQELSGGDDDGFMELPDGIDIDDDFAFLGGGSASQLEQVAAAEDRVSSSTQQMAESMERAGAAGNLFTPVVEGLKELYSISGSMPDMTPLMQLKDVLSKIGGTSGQNAAIFLPQIASGIQSLNVDLPGYGPQLMELAQGLRALGSGNIVTASQVLPFLADGLRDLNAVGTNVTANVEAISALAGAIKQFGYAKIDKTIVNLPTLAKELRSMMDTLSTAPQVSENTIMLLNALGKLNVNGATAMRSFNGLSGGLHRYTNAARRAHKQTVSLASVAGRMYANFFLLFRLFRKAADSIDLASQLKEVQNVVDVTFSDMSDKMNAFAKEAVDTIGMSELTAKQVGSRFQAMGSAMGISRDMVRETNDFVQTATNGYVDVANSMGDVSLNLTKLAGDMASFYNQDYEEVAERLNAVFTGQTRPLRAYGLDLTQATLKAWALKNGLNADIKEMSQAEKTMLRYQYVMANTTAAQGDFQKTISTWANQTRIAQERLKQLQIVLGQIGIYTFKPLVMNFNNAMNTIIDLATSTLNSLGKIFGWQIEWSDAGVLRDDTEGLEDVADGYDDAADSAKKFKNMLLGIDELNLLPDNSDKGKKDGDEIAGLYGDLGDMYKNLNVTPIEGYFDSLYDTLFKLGKRIGEVEKEWLQGINWERIFDKARRFGEGLADFLNGYLSDSELFYEKGKFIANGINTIANALDAFFRRFNGWQLGVDLGNMINGFTGNLDWNVIRSAAYEMAHDIAQTINGAMLTTDWKMVGSTIANGFNTAIDFLYTLGDEINWTAVGDSIAEGLNSVFENFDFVKAAKTLNKWADGILEAMLIALKRTDWEMIGSQIGDFIANIDILKVASKVGKILWEIFNAGIKLWTGLFDSAPIETGLVTALAIPFSNRNFRRNFGTLLSKFSMNLGATLSNDLSKVFNGEFAKIYKGEFTDYFLRLDTLGMTGTWGEGAVKGINAVSKEISTGLKTIGGVATVATEFVVIKDAVSDVVSGMGSLDDSIFKVIGTLGLATTALTILFGVPAGIAIAGVGAAVGALKGYSDGLKELERITIIGTLTEDMGESYTKMSELTGAFSTISGEIQSTYQAMSGKSSAIDEAKENLSEVAQQFTIIGEAAEGGHQIALTAIEELGKDIDGLRSKWEEYINASYDYLIAQAYADYSALKQQGVMNDTEEQAILDRIGRLTDMKNAELEFVEEITNASSEAWETMHQVEEEFGKDSDEFIAAQEEYQNSIKEIADGLYNAGVTTTEAADKYAEAYDKLNNVAGLVDFSELGSDKSNYGEFVENFKTQTQEMQKDYNETINLMLADMDRFEKETIAKYGGLTDDALRDIEQNRTRTENEMALYREAYYGVLEDFQDSLYAKIYKMVGYENADYDMIAAYAEQIIQPIYEELAKEMGEAGDQVAPDIKDRVDAFLEEAFTSSFDSLSDEDKMAYLAGSYTGTLAHYLNDDWQKTWHDIGDEFSEAPYEALMNSVGQASGTVNLFAGVFSTAHAAVSGLTGGIKEASGVFSRFNQAGNGTYDTTLNINRAMVRFGQNSPVMRGALANIGNELDKASQKAQNMKGSVETLSTSFETSKNKMNNAKAFDSVKKSTDDAVAGIDNLRDKTTNTASVLQTSLSVMSGYIKTAFEGITSTENVFVQGFQDDLTKLFSTQTWEAMITGVPNAFRSMWESTMKVMKTMWNDFSKWVNQNAVIEIPKTKVGNTEIGGVHIKMQIPKYETGGFPEDGFFYANHTEMVGSFSNGKTAVANNEQITEGIANAVYRAMTEAMAATGGNVNVELRGDAAALFTAVVKENNNYIMRTGSSPIRV